MLKTKKKQQKERFFLNFFLFLLFRSPARIMYIFMIFMYNEWKSGGGGGAVKGCSVAAATDLRGCRYDTAAEAAVAY